MTAWMCERMFEVTVGGAAAVVPIRFVVEAATGGEAARLAEGAGAVALRLLAGVSPLASAAGPAVVLYPL